MSILSRIFRHSPIRYAVAAGIALLVAFLCLLRTGFDLRIYYMDALSTAGAVVILLGLLFMVAYFGAFDTFGYSFSTIRSSRRYKDLYAYSEAKKEKRHKDGWTFMPFLTVGTAFLIIGLLLGIGL